MIRPLAAVAAAIMLPTIAVDAGTKREAAMTDDVKCRIEASDERGVTYLTAIVESAHPLRGQAALSVQTRGAAGQSANTQGSAFAIDAAGGQAVVGRVGVSSGPGTTVKARLTAAWEGGQTDCAYP